MKQLTSVLILMLMLTLMGSATFGETDSAGTPVTAPDTHLSDMPSEPPDAKSGSVPDGAVPSPESRALTASVEPESLSGRPAVPDPSVVPPTAAVMVLPSAVQPTGAGVQPANPSAVPATVTAPVSKTVPQALKPAVSGKTSVTPAVLLPPEPLPEARAFPVPDGQSILSRNSILSYYGHPNSKRMGILGEYSMEELSARMKKIAAEYDYRNGDRGVVLAFHLIYGTVWQGGDIGYLSRQKVESYIEFAEKNGMLVFLDHQLGKYDVKASVKTMLPFLSHPCVQLAIDPEWHTLEPGTKLGNVTGDDVNAAQEVIDTYLRDNGIPGRKILIVHQFNPTMIRGRERIRADYPRIDLVLNADGFGNPNQKYGSYGYNAEASNIPLKGFKLFFPTSLRNWGWDSPLLRPEEVLKLNPQPLLIMYQ